MAPWNGATVSAGAALDRRDRTSMLLIVISMVLVLALAGLVTAYVAYPDRGEPIPHRARMSDRMTERRSRNER